MFNKAQQEVIDTIKGPLLCVACPGSGKTTTIIARIINMLDKGIDGKRILPITFTVAAKDDMQKRFKQSAPAGYSNEVKFRTIHSLAMMVCMSFGYDIEHVVKEFEYERYLMDVAKKDDKVYKMLSGSRSIMETIKSIVQFISFVKNAQLNPVEFKPDSCPQEAFKWGWNEVKQYQKNTGKIDWDDMIIIARDTLRDNATVRAGWQAMWDYVMVDEFQDTNRIQYDLINLLVEKHRNICVVGDDDQSMYGFRGAESSLILGFPEKYPDCKKIDLSINYRSEPGIIAIAGSLIKNNKYRFEKGFQSHKTGQAEINCVGVDNKMTETWFIVKDIVKKHEAGVAWEDMSVLYRTNIQASTIAGLLIREKIPVHMNDSPIDIHKDLAFRDIVAYMKLCSGEATEGNIRSTLIRPSKYLSKDVINRISGLGSLDDRSKVITICKEEDEKRTRDKKKAYLVSNVQEMYHHLSVLKKYYNEDNVTKFVDYLFDKMGYKENLLENAETYGRDADEWEFILDEIEREAYGQTSFAGWMKDVADYADILKIHFKKKDKEGVCLSTFHSAKGLEWEHVYILDVNDGVCPYKKAKTQKELEEERRAFYVAVTRSKKYLTFVYTDFQKGRTIDVSPYLEEMQINEKLYSKADLSVKDDLF